VRHLCIISALVLGRVAAASAQTPPRFDIGPVVRIDRVMVEAGVTSTMPLFGAAGSARLAKGWALEGEITQAHGSEFSRTYDGTFVSFAAPNSSRAEIERLAVRARWRSGYRPGLGGSLAAAARAGLTGRADLVLRFGAAVRRYAESRDFTILSIPEGIDPRRVPTLSYGSAGSNAAFNHVRGGLLVGIEVPIRLGPRVNVSPDVRYVYGGPARLRNKHRELSLGVRAGWGF
jgi:hypothetical protein